MTLRIFELLYKIHDDLWLVRSQLTKPLPRYHMCWTGSPLLAALHIWGLSSTLCNDVATKFSRKSEHVFDKTKRLFCALHYLIRPRWSVTAPAPGLRHLRDITFRCCLLICRQTPASGRRILAGWAHGGWALSSAACVRWRWLHRWRSSRPSSRRKAATVRCIKWAERRPATRRTWMSWLISKVPVETLAEFYVLCL